MHAFRRTRPPDNVLAGAALHQQLARATTRADIEAIIGPSREAVPTPLRTEQTFSVQAGEHTITARADGLTDDTALEWKRSTHSEASWWERRIQHLVYAAAGYRTTVYAVLHPETRTIVAHTFTVDVQTATDRLVDIVTAYANSAAV